MFLPAGKGCLKTLTPVDERGEFRHR